jgi:hypothetical protein
LLDTSSTSRTRITFLAPPSGIDWAIIASGSGVAQGAGKLLFYNPQRDGNGAAMTIDAAANVGIGTVSPTQRLDVAGNIAVSGVPVIDANGNWVGNPTGLIGPIGLTGSAGASGAQSHIGLTGANGAASTAPGPTGPVGPPGSNGIQGVPGPQGPQGLPYNPLQVALLRWYPAIQTGVQFAVTSAPLGYGPTAVAFDGANIWVTNTGSNTVSKLRANDGTTLGTFSVNANPYGITFDGANIWVTIAGSNTVSELSASDGSNVGTFNTGTFPTAIAFDGANIWVVNSGSNSVSKF